MRCLWLVCTLYLLLIQEFTIARPLVTTPTTSAATNVADQDALPSSPPPSSLPPSTSSSTTSTSSSYPPSSSASPTNVNSADFQSSLLKTLLRVMEDRRKEGEGEGGGNRSSLSSSSSSSANGEPPVPNRKSSKQSQGDDKISTLTLVAIIAVIVAIFISGLFIAVLCPHKIHPKLLFKHCPHLLLCLPRDQGHHRQRTDNFRHHDPNNSTATMVNESVSSSSATSNQNFNVSDNNGCNCLKHNYNTPLNTLHNHMDFIYDSNANRNNPTFTFTQNSQNGFHSKVYNPQSNAGVLNSMSENKTAGMRRQNSRGSVYSNCSKSDALNLNAQENRNGDRRRHNSRSNIITSVQSNSCPPHSQLENSSNFNSQDDRLNGLRKQISLRSVHSNDPRNATVGATYKQVRTTPRPNPCNSGTILQTPSNDRNQTTRPITPAENQHFHNILLYPTESHSGGSNENANLESVSGIGAANIHGNIGFPERRSGGRHSRKSSVVLTGNDVWAEDHPCPYCDADDLQIERTWFDHENRQHSAL